MQIHGLLIEGRTKTVIRSIADNVGEVPEVKIEFERHSSLVVGRAKVTLKLSNPLEPGTISIFKEKEHWLDFRCKRLLATTTLVARLATLPSIVR